MPAPSPASAVRPAPAPGTALSPSPAPKDACKLDQELTSTGGVIEAVAGNPNAIGYASLSAVEGKDTVKAVTVGGVACTEETVLDGSYAIQRPFVLVTKDRRGPVSRRPGVLRLRYLYRCQPS